MKRNNEYYAVIEGRLEKPTVFSSWGDVHPRVTGCKSIYKGFINIQDARDYMKRNGIAKFKEVLKEGAGDTTPIRGKQAFYAVANGAKPGIRPYWTGGQGSKVNVERFPGACHKHFRTESQAKAFLEDWRTTFVEVQCDLMKKRLD